MSQPGTLRVLGDLLLHEWRLEFRRGDTLPTMGLFALSSLITFEFAFELSRADRREWLPAALWTVWSFASLVPFAAGFRRERRDGTWTALRFTAISPSLWWTAKTIAAWVKLSILQLLGAPLMIVLFAYPPDADWARAGLSAALHGFGFAVLGTLAGGLAAHLDRGEALVALLVFPLSAPLFLSAVRSTGTLLAGGPWPTTTLAAVACFDLLFLSIGWLLWETLLDESP
jgi:heme exporter protein B